MPKIVDEMPDRSRASKYPWAEWLDGRVWCLEPGVDFETSVEGFRSSAHNAAKRAGVALETVVKEDGVYLQALIPEEDEETAVAGPIQGEASWDAERTFAG